MNISEAPFGRFAVIVYENFQTGRDHLDKSRLFSYNIIYAEN